MPPTASTLPRRTRSFSRHDVAVLAVAALAYLPLVSLGFGADIDSAVVVEAASQTVSGAGYVPSRPPGYPVYEAAVGGLDLIGGSVATNLGSLAFALLTLAAFLALCRRLGVPHRALLGLTFALHPIVWVNAGSTMDYLWALGLGLAGGVALLDRRWLGAGLLLALAIGVRFTSVLFIGPMLGLALWNVRGEARGWRGPLGAAVLAGVLGAACYLPSLLHYGGLSDALTPVGIEAQETWTFVDHLGRFVYKNVYFWGLPAALWIAGLLARAAATWPGIDRRRGPILAVALGVVVLYEALFLRYPLEQEYLLPILPFALLGLGLLAQRRALIALFVLVLAYNAVSVNLARPDRPNRATRVEVGVWVEPGYLAMDVAQRLRVRGCRSEACWLERSDHGFFPDLFDGE